jgi:hypothetical protein
VQCETGGGDREAGRVREPQRDVEVVGDPFEFGMNDADQGGLAGDLAARDRLGRVAIGEGVIAKALSSLTLCPPRNPLPSGLWNPFPHAATKAGVPWRCPGF